MTLAEITKEIKDEFPMVRIVEKDSMFWRVMGWCVMVITFGSNRAFCTNYTTTFGPVIAFPVNVMLSDNDKVRTLRHERIHLRQIRYCGFGNFWVGIPIFMFAYTFLFFPLGLAYCRYCLERTAYVESLRAAHDDGVKRDTLLSYYVPTYVSQLTTGAYMWAWPFKNTVEKFFRDRVDEITPA